MISVKEFIKNFDYKKSCLPAGRSSWDNLPDGFPKCDLRDLSTEEIGAFSSILTYWELAHPPKSNSTSRVWTNPEGYRFLGVWQNASLLRALIRKFTLTLPLNPTLNNPYHKPLEFRLKAQLDDAARSVIRNIEEGFKRPTTKEYLRFLGYSQASLEEVKGDIRDAKTDGFLPSRPLSTLKNTLNIDLSVYKGTLKGQASGDPASDPHHPYYQPLTTLNPKTLTYEILTELINKTDYLLRTLVESLERK